PAFAPCVPPPPATTPSPPSSPPPRSPALDARALPRHDDFDPASADYIDWYDGAISPQLEHGREYYLAQLEIMDREIGRLLDHLRSEEHTSELQSRFDIVCRVLLVEKDKTC